MLFSEDDDISMQHLGSSSVFSLDESGTTSPSALRVPPYHSSTDFHHDAALITDTICATTTTTSSNHSNGSSELNGLRTPSPTTHLHHLIDSHNHNIMPYQTTNITTTTNAVATALINNKTSESIDPLVTLTPIFLSY